MLILRFANNNQFMKKKKKLRNVLELNFYFINLYYEL